MLDLEDEQYPYDSLLLTLLFILAYDKEEEGSTTTIENFTNHYFI
jgi:hypothetical protein